MRKLIKGFFYAIFFIGIGLPLYLVYSVLFLSSSKCFETISQLISLIPGYIGYFIRKSFYKLSIGSGKNFYIGFGSTLVYHSVVIKDDLSIGVNCQIAKATINNGVKIGSNVYVVNKHTHSIGKNKEVLPTNVEKLKRVDIGENTWIGNSSVIMEDIGKNCIIGAGSVVVKPIPDNSVAAGNPAKVIRKII